MDQTSYLSRHEERESICFSFGLSIFASKTSYPKKYQKGLNHQLKILFKPYYAIFPVTSE
jgi:hypothetical protein